MYILCWLPTATGIAVGGPVIDILIGDNDKPPILRLEERVPTVRERNDTLRGLGGSFEKFLLSKFVTVPYSTSDHILLHTRWSEPLQSFIVRISQQ